jgi:hypothetical protein
MGEYARSLCIARAARERWPHAQIHFLLSREAPYAAGTPFATTLLPSSATFHTGAVTETIDRLRPHVVIFDNAGRTRQLRAARRAGSRVVYISARARQRGKAFRFSWMRLIDEHWIAYPALVAGGLSWVERCKLRWLRRPVLRYLDVILPKLQPMRDAGAPSPVPEGRFVLVVPGGGTGHPGAGDAVAVFMSAATMLAESGLATVFVGPPPPPPPPSPPAPPPKSAGSALLHAGLLPQADLAGLMRLATLVVVNGGSTLLQAIACGRPCLAIPIAGDQALRIRRCVNARVAIAAPLEAALIAQTAARLMRDDAQREALAERAANLKLADGLEVALDALTGLMRASAGALQPAAPRQPGSR